MGYYYIISTYWDDVNARWFKWKGVRGRIVELGQSTTENLSSTFQVSSEANLYNDVLLGDEKDMIKEQGAGALPLGM